MHIRCPHCQNAIEVVEDAELQDLICPSCGSSFNLLPDETVSRQSRGQQDAGPVRAGRADRDRGVRGSLDGP